MLRKETVIKTILFDFGQYAHTHSTISKALGILQTITDLVVKYSVSLSCVLCYKRLFWIKNKKNIGNILELETNFIITRYSRNRRV